MDISCARLADSNLSGEEFVSCWSAYHSESELAVEIYVAVRRCIAKRFSTSRGVRFVIQGRRCSVRCKWANISVVCIGNNHSPIMARRNRVESARTGRIWARIVQRVVVVFRANMPGNQVSFETRPRPERKFAGSLADRAGFEPAVAVTPRTLSKRVP